MALARLRAERMLPARAPARRRLRRQVEATPPRIAPEG
jgi:hypothetical protein